MKFVWCLVLTTFLAVSSADNPLENIWAVLIAGSNGWYNYRHQSDVAHSYHLLLKHGVLPEKIIVLMYDDIAHNPQNPYMGKIFNKPNGSDVYAGVKIDYRGRDVNAETFLNVLKGNATGNNGKGTGRVLKSTRQEHVFVYYSDHGGTDVLGMPTGLMSKHDLDLTLSYMYEKDMYNKFLFYLEACESGSMFEGIPKIMRIYAITAARFNESSYATFCDNNMHLPCLGDEFSVNWMYDTELNNILQETVGTQVDDVVKATKLSHVCQFGDISVRKDTVSEYQGKETIQKPKINEIEDTHFHLEVVQQAVNSRDAQLVMAEKAMRRLGAAPGVVSDQMAKYLFKREVLTDFVRRAAHEVAPESPLLKTVMTKIPQSITQTSCHDKVIKAFDRLCVPFDRNPYAFKLSAALANLCELTRDPQAIIDFFEKECPNGPIFENVTEKYWQGGYMEICSDPKRFFSSEPGLSSYRIRVGLSYFNIEVRSQDPVLVRFPQFLSEKEISRVLEFQKKQQLESLKVYGQAGDFIMDYRIADGNYLSTKESGFLEVQNRLQEVLKVNLTTSEGLLLLKYGIGGHYAPHYDGFSDSPRKDEWLIKHGNRVATTLFILKTADSGGGTIFPELNLVVQPDPGDAIFWINCDSNEINEKKSLHGACPILGGTKIATSMWI
ncbi:hypothetical protein FO519_006159, partial [Halicephalobus sp. NKZ332]